MYQRICEIYKYIYGLQDVFVRYNNISVRYKFICEIQMYLLVGINASMGYKRDTGCIF